MRRFGLFLTFALLLTLLLGACNLPWTVEETPDLVSTWVAATLTEIATSAPATSATQVPIATATTSQPLVASDTPLPPSTPQNPLVLETILCWKGPGAKYEVVSSLKKGERVELLGQGSLAGWLIVNNPIYHDPCWAQSEYLQIEPGYNIYVLPVFTPPPSPTPSPTETRTPTSTPSATNTP